MKTAILVVILLAGVITLAGAVVGREGMYQNRRAKAIVAAFGITGARLVYGIIGSLMILGALLGILGFFG